MPSSRSRFPWKFSCCQEPVLEHTLIWSGPASHRSCFVISQAMSLRILTSSRAFLPAASRGLYALLRVPSVNHAAACAAHPAPRRSWAQEPLASPVRQVRLASSSSEGPITSELISSMRQKIAKALETELVEVQDMQGDGRHVEITVISSLFEGKSAVNRQRMVYKAIWEELQDTVHAVDAMVTRTPEEAGV